MIHQIIELVWDGEPADFSFEVYPHLLLRFGGKLVGAELIEAAQQNTKADLHHGGILVEATFDHKGNLQNLYPIDAASRQRQPLGSSAQGVKMQRDVFLKLLQAKIAQITFSGHRVNDEYTLNKRMQIFKAVVSTFDDAAKHSVEPTPSEIGGAKPDVVVFDDIHETPT